MPKIKYDVSDVEAAPDYDTPVPRGVYRCKISAITHGPSKSSGRPMLTVEYEVVEKGDWKGRKLWDYIVLDDSSAWKLKQFTDALGLKGKGQLDTDDAEGSIVLVRVKHETDDRDPEDVVVRARVGHVSALPEDDDDAEAEEPEAEEEEEEDPDEDPDEDGEEEEELSERADLDEYDRDDLEALIEEEELEVKRTPKLKLATLRDRVWDALGIDEEDEEEEEEEEADYSDMSTADLKAELKTRGLATSGPKSKLVKRLEEDDKDGNEPF